ncbi:MAG: Na(+)-translocating NADH-quinone reductase subunit A [Acidobacteria bacterium]|nr:MAG: Na(+)-translocating NADH-quinone reductase subunit A [Acidobacteriota bacterium]REK00280.1 MAG: Na(+)-translocating NADH-quinone reductase subunit A [Acidobacteriota bacterium]
MGSHHFRKGLDLPIKGVPEQIVSQASSTSEVAVVALDFAGMRPTMMVDVGDAVRTGQKLFEDKKNPGVFYTAPGSGQVTGIHRGAKRRLLSVVIRLDGGDQHVGFSSYTGRHPSSLSREEVRELLVESGSWPAIRARPYDRVAVPESVPKSIFVTAVDSHPLAPDLAKVAEGRAGDLERGLAALRKLTDGKIYFCKAKGARFDLPEIEGLSVESFSGPHPSGNVGLHIHTLDPVNRTKLVWHVGLQEVLAMGKLFGTGELDLERVVSIGGPCVARPRLLRTRVGAALAEVLDGEIEVPGEDNPLAQWIDDGSRIREAGEAPAVRMISGSVLAGRAAGEHTGYLGRYHQSIAVIEEDAEREFLGWMGPGAGKFSVTNLFLSKLMMGKRFDFTTSTNGSPRAIVPIGLYEKVTPFDLEPTFLLKALVMSDVERAEEFGVLELAEEDVGLYSFVCPGKTDYAPHLRETLTILEKEG